MTEQQTKEVRGYIERAIPDIARKCGVKCDEVEQQMAWLCGERILDFGK